MAHASSVRLYSYETLMQRLTAKFNDQSFNNRSFSTSQPSSWNVTNLTPWALFSTRSCGRKREVYVAQLTGFDDDIGRVCKLKKALYGLQRSSLCRYIGTT